MYSISQKRSNLHTDGVGTAKVDIPLGTKYFEDPAFRY
jgi:hypothetical protein